MAPVPISTLNVGHIDDVQELRKTKPKTIPQRFVRDMTERPTLDDTALSSPQSDLPVIDFSKLSKGNKEEVLSELCKLAIACEEWGFFQVNTTWLSHFFYYLLPGFHSSKVSESLQRVK